MRLDLLGCGRARLSRAALDGCEGAYFLVHGMGSDEEGDFEERERQAALSFRAASARQGLDRIIYLGGIAPQGRPSKHLRSRLKTGELLRAGSVPCVELRASMIIGQGSESWRMLRDLTARLPVMMLPRWLESRTQPIAIEDVVYALVESMRMPLEASVALPLPGPKC